MSNQATQKVVVPTTTTTTAPGLIKPGVWLQVAIDVRKYVEFCDGAVLSNGVWTIGYGFTEGVKKGDLMPHRVAEELLEEHIVDAVIESRKWVGPEFDNLCSARQSVIVGMMYSMRAQRMHKWRETLKALREHDYEGVVARMEGSLWHTQQKRWCTKLITRMKTGRIAK